MFTQSFRFFFILIACFGLYACGGGDTNNDLTLQGIEEIQIKFDDPQLTTQSQTQITVNAIYEDDSKKDITSEVSLVLNDNALASLDNTGILTTNNLISTLEITASYQDFTTTKAINIAKATDATLSNIKVSDLNVLESAVIDQNVNISIIYSDGSVQEDVVVQVKRFRAAPDSTTSSKVELSINNENIEVDLGESTSNETSVTYVATKTPSEDKVLTELVIQAPQTEITSGEKVTLTVEATYDDDTTESISNINWEISGPAIIEDNILLASDVSEVTTATVSITIEGVSTSLDFSIAPALLQGPIIDVSLTSLVIHSDKLTLTSGESSAISLEALYSDDSSAFISNGKWAINGPINLNADASEVTAQAVTQTTTANLTAEVGNLTQTLEFTISPLESENPILETITIKLSKTELLYNESTEITVIGNYSNAESKDLTNEVNWSLSNEEAATINNNALTVKEITGPVTITATISGKTATHEINISPLTRTLESLSLNWNEKTLSRSESIQLTLTAHYNDGEEIPNSGITWQSEDTNIASVDNNGLVTTKTAGSTKINVTFGGFTTSFSLTVEEASLVLKEIILTANKTELVTSEKTKITATGVYSNGIDPDSNSDITNAVTWSASDSQIVKINASSETNLEALNKTGPATVTAALGETSASIQINVSVPSNTLVNRIELQNPPESIIANREYNLPKVFAYFENNIFTDVSTEVTWQIENQTLLKINDKGLLESNNQLGSTTITAHHAASNLSTSFNALVHSSANLAIDTLYFESPPSTIFFNGQAKLTLKAIYTNGTESTLSQNISWESNNPESASIDSTGKITASNLQNYVVIKATYFDPVSETSKWVDIGINILPENSFDNLNLVVNDQLQKTLIEDNSNYPALLSSFYNPVGITDNLVYYQTTPGYFITFESTTSEERLVIVLPSKDVGSLDQTNSYMYYVPTNNNQQLFMLSNSEATNLSVTIESFGNIGEVTNGIFSATLCEKAAIDANTCHLSGNHVNLSGSFYVTVDTDATFASTNDIGNPELINPSNFEHVRQIAVTPNYYYEITIPGVDYEFKTDHPEVSLKVIDIDNSNTVLATSTLNSDSTGQIITYQAINENTYLQLEYNGDSTGTTFKVSNHQHELTAQGTATTPFILGTGKIPLLSHGTVDINTSYYEASALIGHSYLIHVANIKNSNLIAINGLSLEVSDTNSPDSFQACDGLQNCEILSNTGNIFFKVTGNGIEAASYDIEIEYAPEQNIDLVLPVVDRLSQVSYRVSNMSALGNDLLFKSGTSNYWADIEQLQPSTHYLISIKGITAFTALYINDPSNGTIEEHCASGGSWSQPATVSSNYEIYCVIKTKSFFGFNAAGFSINVVGEYSTTGTPFTLNVNSIESSKIFYVNTYANGKTTCENGVSCFPIIGMNFYRPGETDPFSFTLYSESGFAQKTLMLEPGEQVFIRLFDALNYGNFYGMQISQDGYKSGSSKFLLVNDPDSFEEGNGDNSTSTATPIQLDEETQHSFSVNDGQFGDEDWFTFTAPIR